MSSTVLLTVQVFLSDRGMASRGMRRAQRVVRKPASTVGEWAGSAEQKK